MENMTNVKCKGIRDVQKVHPQMEWSIKIQDQLVCLARDYLLSSFSKELILVVRMVCDVPVCTELYSGQ